MKRVTLEVTSGGEYELLDCGREAKLEKYGSIVLARPDPQALWEKTLPDTEWEKADGRYVREGREGKWVTKQGFPKEWPIQFGGFTLLIRPTSFKHTGIFPEQEPNWAWISESIKKANREVRVLNLFAYTGGATLAAAAAGAEVTHVDASKTAVAWAKENVALSDLTNAPIRWITEDVLLYVRREIKRGSRYDLIVMDPPAFGHGPKDEIWNIEEGLVELIALCGQLLTEKPLGMLINGYAAGYSPLTFAYNIEPFVKKYGGEVEFGDLTIANNTKTRSLPCGIFTRWRTI